MVISLGYSLVAWALVPPLAWDEVSYHLPIPQIYIDAGGFVSIPTIVHSNWPAGMEMLNMIALLMGSEILPHLVVTAMVVLTALGVFRFAYQHLDPSTGWLAAALYLTMPMVRFLAGVALIEGALGFFGFMAIWSGYEWLESRSWRDLALAGVLGGLTASIKLTGAAIPIGVGLVVLVCLLLRHRNQARGHLAQFVAYGAIALIVTAPWYLRGTINTGNPVWPFMYQIFGGRYWDALGDQMHTSWLHVPNLDRTPWSYIAGLWYLTVRAEQFGGLRIGGAIMLLTPLSLLFSRHRSWLYGYLGNVCMVVYTLWFFTTHQTRFLMGIIPTLTLLAAFAFIQLLRLWPPHWAALGRVGMVVYLVLLLPLGAAERAHITNRWPYVAGRIHREEFLSQEVTGYPAFQFANEHLPADARVLLALWETRGYYVHRASIWANPISQRVIKWEQFDDVASLAEQLRLLGITHVLHNEHLTIPGITNAEHTNEILNAFLGEYGMTLYEQAGFRVYELRTAP